MAPEDMARVAAKAAAAGNERVLLTERGVSFGYHNLVVDMRSYRDHARHGLSRGLRRDTQRAAARGRRGRVGRAAGVRARPRAGGVRGGLRRGLHRDTSEPRTALSRTLHSMIPLSELREVRRRGARRLRGRFARAEASGDAGTWTRALRAGVTAARPGRGRRADQRASRSRSVGRRDQEFSVRDGIGIRFAQRAGIEVVFLSARVSEIVKHRAEMLGVTEVHQGEQQKLDVVRRDSRAPRSRALVHSVCRRRPRGHGADHGGGSRRGSGRRVRRPT